MPVDTSGESRKVIFFTLPAIPMLLLRNVQSGLKMNTQFILCLYSIEI